MDILKDELKNNVSMKLDCIKNRNVKNYNFERHSQYSELKADSILYKIPEFSTPEINYEVS